MSLESSIGWCNRTINVVSGCSLGCEYCYARNMSLRLAGRFGYPKDDPFKPTFHVDKLDDIYNLPKAHSRVFLDSMGDLFDPGVKGEWLTVILQAVRYRSDHTFLVLTKQPQHIPLNFQPPRNLWLGVSVTAQADMWRISKLKESIPGYARRFVSFEPLLGPINLGNFGGVDWVIVGAESGNRKGRSIPERAWVEEIMRAAAHASIPIFVKDNLEWMFHHDPAGMSWLKMVPEEIQ